MLRRDSPCLREASDDGNTGLGDCSSPLQLPKHSPEQCLQCQVRHLSVSHCPHLVIIKVLVDALTGVASSRLATVQLVELDHAGKGKLVLLLLWLLLLLLLLLLMLLECVRSIPSAHLTKKAG